MSKWRFPPEKEKRQPKKITLRRRLVFSFIYAVTVFIVIFFLLLLFHDIDSKEKPSLSEIERHPTLFLSIFLLLLISLLFSFLISRHFLHTLLKALDTIRNNTGSQEAMPKVPYQEINDFFSFLSQKDRENEKKLLQLTLEKQKIEQEVIKTQIELKRLAIRQKEELDPDCYRQFLTGLHSLTPKEREIFHLYLDGKSPKEVLALEKINQNTLKYHNRNIYGKLGVSSRKELLCYATVVKQDTAFLLRHPDKDNNQN